MILVNCINTKAVGVKPTHIHVIMHCCEQDVKDFLEIGMVFQL